jgi:hypothetical protein
LLVNCQFTTKYFDLESPNKVVQFDENSPYKMYQIYMLVDFDCDEESLASGLCIFHDKDYLQDKTNNEEHKRKVLDRLKQKIDQAIFYDEPLLCIGFRLPDFSLSDLGISKEFTKPVYFGESRFFGKGFFIVDKFQRTASSIEPSLPSQPSPLSDLKNSRQSMA